MFDKVLIANRGEIACRVIRTLRKMGIASVAVYSDADAGARHVGEANEAVRIGPASAALSYLDMGAVIAAALATGAQAIHPGYGFLAENAEFAELCAQTGIVFLGPSPRAIRTMGDKISARHAVEERGVPTVPGVAQAGMSNTQLIGAADGVGYPLLIKPSAGGGGKGMHVVRAASELAESLASARREAAASFGDDTLFLERYVTSPRHIEIQVLADAHGNVVHLGERDCTLQRRHQKVIEEAPSPIIDNATRARLGAAACETARSVGYTGAGTVEFIVSSAQPDEFFFMEMNTRLQVEHPVTELVTGLDLVEQQLRIAAGEPLSFTQNDVVFTGHAIEARVYAEDPSTGFLPAGGTVVLVVEPSDEGIRVDSALQKGVVVSPNYDPMLAKVIAFGADRPTALGRLRAALNSTVVLGVTTNIEFLSLLLASPEVAEGAFDTEYIGRAIGDLTFAKPEAPVLATAALIAFERDRATASAKPPWGPPSGWRLGPAAPSVFRLEVDGYEGEHEVVITGTADAAAVVVDGAEPIAASVILAGEHAVAVTLDGIRRTVPRVTTDEVLEFADGPRSWRVIELRRSDARRPIHGDADPTLTSPMPGTVVAISVPTGSTVAVGDAILVVEAMKMEHVLRAQVAGTVAVAVAVGESVARGQVLATVKTPAEDE